MSLFGKIDRRRRGGNAAVASPNATRRIAHRQMATTAQWSIRIRRVDEVYAGDGKNVALLHAEILP